MLQRAAVRRSSSPRRDIDDATASSASRLMNSPQQERLFDRPDDSLPTDIRGYHSERGTRRTATRRGRRFSTGPRNPRPTGCSRAAARSKCRCSTGARRRNFRAARSRPRPRPRRSIKTPLACFSNSPSASARGRILKARHGRCATTRPAATCIRRRPTPSCPACQDCPAVRASITTRHSHHELEQRARWPQGETLAAAEFHVGLTSITWREAWKYGERAFRYCQHDVGHALRRRSRPPRRSAGARAFCRSHRTMRSPPCSASTRADAAHRREPEYPDLLLWIATGDEPAAALDLAALIAAPRDWTCAANRLSEDHDGWPVIDAAVRFCHKGRTAPLASISAPAPALRPSSARALTSFAGAGAHSASMGRRCCRANSSPPCFGRR